MVLEGQEKTVLFVSLIRRGESTILNAAEAQEDVRAERYPLGSVDRDDCKTVTNDGEALPCSWEPEDLFKESNDPAEARFNGSCLFRIRSLIK